jgi:hypothetical protein
MASYTEEDGQRLSKGELLRLLLLANGYEMVWCVEECAQALLPFDGYDDARAYFQCVPDSLLYTEPLRSATMAAGDALASALGPVEQLWRPADTHSGRLIEDYVMDDRITFSLALWWILGQKGMREERQPLFNRLLKSLRYARMSAVFLASIAQEDWVKDSGVASSILVRGLWRRDDVPRRNVPRMPPSRVVDSEEYRVQLSTSFARNDIDALEAGDRLKSPLGFLHGLPCQLHLVREEYDCISFLLFSNFLLKEEEEMMTRRERRSGRGRTAMTQSGGLTISSSGAPLVVQRWSPRS